MSTTVAIVLYIAYAGWRVYVDVAQSVSRKKQEQDTLRRLAAVESLRPRVERLETIANSDPYGLPKPLEL